MVVGHAVIGVRVENASFCYWSISHGQGHAVVAMTVIGT